MLVGMVVEAGGEKVEYDMKISLADIKADLAAAKATGKSVKDLATGRAARAAIA